MFMDPYSVLLLYVFYCVDYIFCEYETFCSIFIASCLK